MTKINPLSSNIDLNYLAKRTPGYVPADLVGLVRKAGVICAQRISETIKILKNNALQK